MLWREDRPMRIALLGCGTVGGGVYEFVQERTDMEIAYVLSRRPRPELNCPVTSDFSRIVSDPTVDTAIEVMGGRQPAYEYMCAALRAGKNVVTANKQLMSERYGELVQLARENHVALRCSAAVGGGIRWLTNLESTLDMEPVLRVSGIMNGTTNYILDTMTTSGLKFEDALRQAQALGYAEVDPTEDLNGADARRKLVISTNVAFGCVVQEPEVTTFGIAGIRACDIGAARRQADGKRPPAGQRRCGLLSRACDDAAGHARGCRAGEFQPDLHHGHAHRQAELLWAGRGALPNGLQRHAGLPRYPQRPDALLHGQAPPGARGQQQHHAAVLCPRQRHGPLAANAY